MLLKLEGVVIKQTKYSDSDRILTILSKQKGKIQAMSKRSRSQKSKIFACSQILTESDFVVYKGRNSFNINQGEVIKSYYRIKEDLDKLSYAMYILELVDASILEGEPNEKVYGLLLKTLDILSDYKGNYKLLILAFELKYMSFIGFKPSLKKCCECSKDIKQSAAFSHRQGGFLCEECKNHFSYDMDLDCNMINCLQKLLYSKLDDIDSIEINEKELDQLKVLFNRYIEYYVEKKDFKSLKFLKAVNYNMTENNFAEE